MQAVVGSDIEIVIDTSHIRNYLAADSKHRATNHTVIRGTVQPTPKWMGDSITVKNSATGAVNYVPPHRIISINNQVVQAAPVQEDRVLKVTSSNGKETYTVRMDGRTKKWSCTCAGWQFRSRCRHIASASEQTNP